MSKFRKSILIFGALILCLAVALGTFLVLTSMGMITADPIAVEFTVADNKKVYDGKPLTADWYEITSGELEKGHHAVVTYEGAITEVGEARSDMTVRIVDEKGYNVTDKYAVKVVGGKLTVLVNQLKIKFSDVEEVYSGGAIACDRYEILSGELGAGHTVVIDGKDGMNVGDRLDFEDEAIQVFDAVGNNVSRNYQIVCEMSNFTILPRPISFAPVGDVTKYYDGLPVSISRYEIVSGSLAEGHYAEVNVRATVKRGDIESAVSDEEDAVTAVSAWGVYTLSVGETDVVIRDKDGKDVTENYEITPASSTVEIKQRPLGISVKSDDNAVYKNAEIMPAYECVSGSLAPKHTVAAVEYIVKDEEGGDASLLNAGTYTVSIDETALKISDDNDADVTDNYELSLGEILDYTIKPCPLTVTGADGSFTYDGNPHKYGETVVDGEIVYPAEAVTAPGDDTVFGHKVTLIYDSSVSVTEVSAPTENLFDILVLDSDDTDMTGNYELIPTYGMLTVEPCPISLATCSGVYSGVAFNFDANKKPFIKSIGSVNSDATEFTPLFESLKDSLTFWTDVEAKNVDTYAVKGASSNENYTVATTGTLNITPKKIFMEYKEGDAIPTVIYGDLPEVKCSNIKLLDVTGVEVTEANIIASSIDYAACTVPLTGLVLRSTANNEDVSKNYVVKCNVDGAEKLPQIVFECKKRVFKVSVYGTVTSSAMYDIDEGGWKSYVHAETALANGDTFELESGQALFEYDYDGMLYIPIRYIKITNSEGTEVTDFYEIKCDMTANNVRISGAEETCICGYVGITPSTTP